MINKRNIISNLEKLHNTVSIKENPEDKIEMKSPYLESLRNISVVEYKIADIIDEDDEKASSDSRFKGFPVIRFITQFLEKEPQS
ncbi:hypothetical protein BX659_10890 [Orenia metallireducens]|jgi:hypothetical protein|uniref:Uncharacterized protein n=1 Tax=Orenia metallireducens TaxID=1413210 RepID=A0A285GPP3_9FIRM|nr:hypothetical protein [Orenia metallireducens]PRX29877.1 hypothetical protein BX659_10890 [Orenia metallireducens]SNY25445.1 hypothetical protein SAMN06265827_10990 [Orenia metallireducens]